MKNARSGNHCPWNRCPFLCHPERSRGICGSTDPSWKRFSTERPVPACRGSEGRDLQFRLTINQSELETAPSPLLHQPDVFNHHKAVILPAPACRGRGCDLFELSVLLRTNQMFSNSSTKPPSLGFAPTARRASGVTGKGQRFK